MAQISIRSLVWALRTILFGFALAACSQGEPLDQLPQGETGRVVRIIDGDALVLDTGLTVRLVGIEAPAPERRNREGEPHADQSARLLEDMIMGREVQLIYPGTTRDRYDRALAYVRTHDALGPDVWVNLEMARRGGARVRIYPDTSLLADELLLAEQDARLAASGLWSDAHYRVLGADDIASDMRGFKLVRVSGLIWEPAENQERYRCSLRVSGTDLRIDVGPAARQLCVDFAGGAIVRGYVREMRLELTHSANFEPV